MLNTGACTTYLSMCFGIWFNASCRCYSFVHTYVKVKQRSHRALSTSSTKIYNDTNMFKYCMYTYVKEHYTLRVTGSILLCFSSANHKHTVREATDRSFLSLVMHASCIQPGIYHCMHVLICLCHKKHSVLLPCMISTLRHIRNSIKFLMQIFLISQKDKNDYRSKSCFTKNIQQN